MGLVVKNDVCPDCGGLCAVPGEAEGQANAPIRSEGEEHLLPLGDRGFLLLVEETYACLRYTRVDAEEVRHEWRCANSGEQAVFVLDSDGQRAREPSVQGLCVRLVELAVLWLASAADAKPVNGA